MYSLVPFLNNGVMYPNDHLLKIFADISGFSTCVSSISRQRSGPNLGASNSRVNEKSPNTTTADRRASRVMTSLTFSEWVVTRVRPQMRRATAYEGQKSKRVEEDVRVCLWLV